MAKIIGIYREQLEESPEIAAKYPSMRDSLSASPIEDKEKIVEFILTGGSPNIVTTANAKDVFTGDDTGVRDCSRIDEEYSWGTVLAYYVERYNLQLPEEFVSHALKA